MVENILKTQDKLFMGIFIFTEDHEYTKFAQIFANSPHKSSALICFCNDNHTESIFLIKEEHHVVALLSNAYQHRVTRQLFPNPHICKGMIVEHDGNCSADTQFNIHALLYSALETKSVYETLVLLKAGSLNLNQMKAGIKDLTTFAVNDCPKMVLYRWMAMFGKLFVDIEKCAWVKFCRTKGIHPLSGIKVRFEDWPIDEYRKHIYIHHHAENVEHSKRVKNIYITSMPIFALPPNWIMPNRTHKLVFYNEIFNNERCADIDSEIPPLLLDIEPQTTKNTLISLQPKITFLKRVSKMLKKDYLYWNTLWDFERKRQYTHIAVADYMLKRYGRSITTDYGSEIGNYYFTNRFQALFVPFTKNHNSIEELMSGLKTIMKDKPIYENTALAHILQILKQKAGANLEGFTIIPKPPTPIAYYVIALFVPIVGWGYLAFKLFEHFDSLDRTCSPSDEQNNTPGI